MCLQTAPEVPDPHVQTSSLPRQRHLFFYESTWMTTQHFNRVQPRSQREESHMDVMWSTCRADMWSTQGYKSDSLCNDLHMLNGHQRAEVVAHQAVTEASNSQGVNIHGHLS
ncbi:hypothetical protein ATANTOWER_030548 [Ataeniobius toweri]|uniref:Uncharacterized protein n=1 Tax=Ataeniobius toweri TaxID=208326 RepID=A0ABU7BJ69_9TELE|nr:hypothetical protein [Ataeniobius toweri]